MAKKEETKQGDSWGEFSPIALKVAEELRSLYSDSKEDAPNKTLGTYPNPTRVIEALKILIDVMFPGRFSSGASSAEELLPFISERLVYASELLGPEVEKAIPFRWIGEAARKDGNGKPENVSESSHRILKDFFEALPAIRQALVLDVKAAYEGDPAALTYAEIQMAYPGLLAISSHRIAHKLHKLGVPIVPRIMSEWTHTQTGADIHPGAAIGEAFFIDHCTGVVIGETAIIGAHVKLYQGVSLGARSFPLDEHGLPVKHIKRHPTVEDGVVLYANAVVFGGDTVIGRDSTIGGGVCVMESVPPESLVLSSRPDLKIKQAQSKKK